MQQTVKGVQLIGNTQAGNKSENKQTHANITSILERNKLEANAYAIYPRSNILKYYRIHKKKKIEYILC